MVRPRKENGRRKSSEESDRTLEEQEGDRKAENAKNPQLKGEDPGSEVVEVNHNEAKTSEASEWERRKM